MILFFAPSRDGLKDFITVTQDYNIKTGAEFFANLLAANNGDVFKTVGKYNGWRLGMTYVRIIPYI